MMTVKKTLSRVFLPVGYPNTVPPEYMSYQKWNLLQDLCIYLRGIMATQTMLSGFGVIRCNSQSSNTYVDSKRRY